MLASFKKSSGTAVVITGAPIISACYSAAAPFSKEHLPLGDGFLPALIFLESFYSNLGCDEADPKGFRRASYDYGLNGTARLDTIKFVNAGECSVSGFTQAGCLSLGGTYSASCTMTSQQRQNISRPACLANGGTYTDTTTKRFQLIHTIPDFELCSGPRIDKNNRTPHDFASGNGSTSSPFTICKEVQLNRIGATNNYARFTLHANLDMNRTSVFGDGTQPLAECSSSDPGQNFTPIGSTYDGSCNETSPASFFGNFDGNGYTISNIRARSEASHTGFIRNGGTIKNLTLKNVEMEGRMYVGAVSGAGATLENINVIGGDIRGESNVGGIAGDYSNTGIFKNNHASDMIVIGKSSYGAIGGLIGSSNYSGTLLVAKSSFKGFLKSYSSDENIGGLIGYRASGGTATVEDSMSNGAILVSGTGSSRAGGLIGHALNGVTFTRSYSRMSIAGSSYKNTFGAASLGGLVGVASSVDVDYSYYFGSILHPCYEASLTNCDTVGTISGSGAPTGSYFKGGMLHTAYTTTVLTNNEIESDLKHADFKTALIANGFKETGAGMPVLTWEQHPCTFTFNTATVAAQASSGRGTENNPIVLCHEDQWKEIKTNSALHYTLADNIALSNVTYADVVPNFSGSLKGNGYMVSGFYMYVSTSQNGGLFQIVSGTIKDVHFAAGVIKTSTGSSLGVTGTLASGAKIEDSHFSSVTVKGPTQTAGIVAATNSGTINRVEVNSHLESSATNMGMLAGVNSSGATLSRSRVEGDVKVTSSGIDVRVGGVVGTNNGIISEVDTGTEIYNNSNANAGSFIGSFAGENGGQISDVLLRPYAKLTIGIATQNYLGNIFGSTTNGSSVNRMVAANELAIDTAYDISSRVNSFSSYSNHTAPNYQQIIALDGSSFEYKTSSYSIDFCTDYTTNFDYTTLASFDNDAAFLDGYFISGYNYGSGRLTSRFTGTHTDATYIINSIVGTNMTMPCTSEGINPSSLIHQIALYPNHAHVTAVQASDFLNVNTFCSPDINSTTGVCSNSTQFDIVEDVPGGLGFNRILNAYGQWITSGEPPTNYPVWTMSDEGYPKLFIVD